MSLPSSRPGFDSRMVHRVKTLFFCNFWAIFSDEVGSSYHWHWFLFTPPISRTIWANVWDMSEIPIQNAQLHQRCQDSANLSSTKLFASEPNMSHSNHLNPSSMRLFFIWARRWISIELKSVMNQNLVWNCERTPWFHTSRAKQKCQNAS